MSEAAAGHAAVWAGVDLAARASELRRLHDIVLSGGRPPGRSSARDVVLRSWRRVMAEGLDADRAAVRDPVPWSEVERRRRESPISLVIDELRHVLTSVADASSFLMVVTDADGCVLWREGSARVRRQADSLGFAEGATWTEAAVGTNAIGTALAEAAPVELFSAEHYENKQHPWYCSAWPMHDPRTGELIGVVDLSGPALTLHPAIRVLVESAVRIAESRLGALHRQQLDVIRRQVEPVLAGQQGPLLVVDDLGWVAHHAGMPRPDRIAAPGATPTVTVPGLGLCVPEHLGDGWLVRPARTAARVSAQLDTASRQLVLRTGEDPWCTTLTRRHVELIAAVVAAGPAGLDAAALSVALHGDAEHVVTVRAEVSRLRRVVGGLLATQPYRIADGVDIKIAGPAAGAAIGAAG